MLTDSHPLESFVTKLERRLPLPPDERQALLALPISVIYALPQDVIAREGEEAQKCLFLSSGVLSRQKDSGTSRRIIAVGLAGDAIDLQSLWFRKQDHTIIAHTRCVLAAVAHGSVIQMCETYPLLRKLLWHDTLVDAAIFREWTINIGHRRALWRIAHLYLEVAERLEANGTMTGDTFEFPFSQSEAASMLGLSLVHFNKSLRTMREQGFISTSGRTITLLDRAAMKRATDFDPSYLHLREPPKLR